MPRRHGRVRSQWLGDTGVPSIGSMLDLAIEWRLWFRKLSGSRRETPAPIRPPREARPFCRKEASPRCAIQRRANTRPRGQDPSCWKDASYRLLQPLTYSTRTRRSFDSRAHGFPAPTQDECSRRCESERRRRDPGAHPPFTVPKHDACEGASSGTAFDDALPASAGRAPVRVFGSETSSAGALHLVTALSTANETARAQPLTPHVARHEPRRPGGHRAATSQNRLPHPHVNESEVPRLETPSTDKERTEHDACAPGIEPLPRDHSA